MHLTAEFESFQTDRAQFMTDLQRMAQDLADTKAAAAKQKNDLLSLLQEASNEIKRLESESVAASEKGKITDAAHEAELAKLRDEVARLVRELAAKLESEAAAIAERDKALAEKAELEAQQAREPTAAAAAASMESDADTPSVSPGLDASASEQSLDEDVDLAADRTEEEALVIPEQSQEPILANDAGFTPLHALAAERPEDTATAQSLIEGSSGNATNARDAHGRTPLHLAAAHGAVDLGKLLIAKGAETTVRDSEGNTPLHAAASSGNVEAITLLVQACPTTAVVSRNNAGSTPLHAAAGSGSVNALDYILALAGVDPLASDNEGRIALHIAAVAGNDGVVALLITRAPSSVNAADKRGNTPLHLAMMSSAAVTQRTATVNLLVSNGADVNAVNNDGWAPLQLAVKSNSVEMVQLMVRAGKVNINAKNRSGETSLYTAAWMGQSANALTLIESGADPNAANNEGWAPLHAAASKGHTDCCRVLLEHGAKVNAQSRQGTTAVFHASDGGHVETVRFLTAQRADLNLSAAGGWKPVHVACNKKRVEVLRFLIEQHVQLDPVCKPSKGYVPLHFLIMSPKPSLPMIEMLLGAGCNANARSASGSTALHLAATMGREEAAMLLIKHPRIDFKIKNNQLRMAVEQAVAHGHESIAKAIAAKMGLKKLPNVARAEVRVKTMATPKAPPKPTDA